jgi:PAS domain S-box-containing protein
MNAPVRILIVDDDEEDFIILKEYISRIEGLQFQVDWCCKYKEAREKVCEGTYHLYFVDYVLGPKTGLELIQESISGSCEEPFILLTGNGNHAIDLKAMESGAVDYLVKGELNTEKLERCIRYSLDRAASLKALKTSERKFRNIFERSKDTVFIADTNLAFTEINDASFNLLRYSREELLTKDLYSFISDKNDIAFIQQALAESGEIYDKEIEVTTKNGERKICILTFSREVDINGGFYIQGILHEITALKKAEQTTLLLEKLNMASRLVRILAHEVRNPLNNIMLAAEQLGAIVSNEESAIYFEIINRNNKRIGDLITELLNSAKATPVTIEKTSLQSIMDQSIEAAKDRISLRNIQLVRDYLEEEAWIMADNEKLKIAFLNIIINAIEAMEEDTGQLSIAIRKNDDQYMVSIQDNGCGISRKDIARLFEPYFTSKKNGMGLGLTSSLNILQSHKAMLDVQSKPNEGTVFNLFFSSYAE